MGQYDGYNGFPGEIHDEGSINCYLSPQNEDRSKATLETKILQVLRSFLYYYFLHSHVVSAFRSY